MKPGTIIGALALIWSAGAAADPAIVILLDEGCWWGDESLVATGNVRFALNDGDIWVLSCHGDLVEGEPPTRALVARSTEDDPIGLCSTSFGSTANWHVNLTPSGKSKFTCWGTVEE